MSSRQKASTSHSLRNKATSVAVGLAITVLAVLADWAGLFDAFELKSYDTRLSWLNKIPASKEIVHIDIDDGSLETIGRWPWPRTTLAELISTLDELGARYIALDILLRQEESTAPAQPGERNGDADLAAAIKDAGNVVVPTHFRPPVDRRNRPEWSARLTELLRQNPFELNGQPLSPENVGAALGVDPMLLAGGLYGRRQEIVDDFALELLTAGEINSELQLLAHYGRLDAGRNTPEYEVVRRAVRRARSILASEKFARVPTQALPPDAFTPGHVDPPIPELVEGAGGVAFIASQADQDFIFRRVPLLARSGQHVYRHYGFFLACEMLGVAQQDIRYDSSGYIVLKPAQKNGKESSIRIPVDRQGQMLVNFRKGPEEQWWESGFAHLPAGKILEISLIRAKRKNNLLKRQAATAEAVRLTCAPEQSRQFDILTDHIAELNDKLSGSLEGPEHLQLRAEITQAEESWGRIRDQAVDSIKFLYDSLPTEPPSDPEELLYYRNIVLFHQDLLGTDFKVENERLAELLADRLARLKEEINGKTCLVGSTASGGAGAALDYVGSPVFRRVPGVVVHGNVINTILQEKFLTQAKWWQCFIVLAGCGLLATVSSSLLKPFHSVIPVVAGLAGYFGVNLLVFAGGLVLPLVPPLTVIVLSFASIMAYRQIFEAREKRRMATALGQFTSPSVAKRILAQPDVLRLTGETRVVTCYFSDLQGFTPLSERIGPEKTVSLLNRYLDKMTEVLFRHEGTVNKFAGDGIFAFFGAPEPQPDHARRACLAAVDSQIALAQLCKELTEQGDTDLRMRVGINTGPAVVGNCGSSRKFDYTALGDTVNLSSRLEPSNKFFGSLILVSKQTFDDASLPEEILSRPLGSIVAVGRTEVTEVVEIVGLVGDDLQRDQSVRKFSAGLEAFKQGRLQEALEVFESCSAIWTEDKPAKVYADLCRKAVKEPRQGPWDPTVRMTSK